MGCPSPPQASALHALHARNQAHSSLWARSSVCLGWRCQHAAAPSLISALLHSLKELCSLADCWLRCVVVDVEGAALQPMLQA